MCARCVFTVGNETNSVDAISRFEQPGGEQPQHLALADGERHRLELLVRRVAGEERGIDVALAGHHPLDGADQVGSLDRPAATARRPRPRAGRRGCRAARGPAAPRCARHRPRRAPGAPSRRSTGRSPRRRRRGRGACSTTALATSRADATSATTSKPSLRRTVARPRRTSGTTSATTTLGIARNLPARSRSRRANQPVEEPPVRVERRVVERHEGDGRDLRRARAHRGHRDLGRRIDRIPVDPGRDRRERHRAGADASASSSDRR